MTIVLDRLGNRVYDSGMMSEPVPGASQTKDLQPDPRDQRIAELEAQLAAALALVARLQARVRELEQQVAELQRSGKRQATPFARKKRSAAPKKPGRKAGQGTFKHRPPPAAEDVQETKDAPLDRCPECGGALVDCKTHEQFEVDIPPVKPVMVRFSLRTFADGAEANTGASWVRTSCPAGAVATKLAMGDAFPCLSCSRVRSSPWMIRLRSKIANTDRPSPIRLWARVPP